MAYNSENKVTFQELAPSLQEMINSKTSQTSFDTTAALVSTVYKNLGEVRITIAAATSAAGSPQNDKELLINTSDGTVQYYNNGWKNSGGVYS